MQLEQTKSFEKGNFGIGCLILVVDQQFCKHSFAETFPVAKVFVLFLI